MQAGEQIVRSRQELEEECFAARRAGNEAVLIGRETLEEATRQGEQLENAERMADETSYKLEKAGRVLRGMTWSGWVANMFAKELTFPGANEEEKKENPNAGIPSVYENAPEPCRAAAQAVQNYHANLKVLATCETDEQTETCHLICENMYDVAIKEVAKLASEVELAEYRDFVFKLEKDLAGLKSRQDIRRRFLERQQREKQQKRQYEEGREALSLSNNGDTKNTPVVVDVPSASPEINQALQFQNDHLDAISQNLDELGNIAVNLSETTDKHGAIVEALDAKSDDILDKSRMVTRRADRLIQKKVHSYKEKFWVPAHKLN
jgi:hypothetical protein